MTARKKEKRFGPLQRTILATLLLAFTIQFAICGNKNEIATLREMRIFGEAGESRAGARVPGKKEEKWRLAAEGLFARSGDLQAEPFYTKFAQGHARNSITDEGTKARSGFA